MHHVKRSCFSSCASRDPDMPPPKLGAMERSCKVLNNQAVQKYCKKHESHRKHTSATQLGFERAVIDGCTKGGKTAGANACTVGIAMREAV